MRTLQDTQDTQAAGETQKGKGKSTTREGQFGSEDKAEKRGKKLAAVVFSDENEQKIVDFLRDNENLYNKHLKAYRFVRRTIGKRCLPKVVPEPAHTLWKGHSHEVGPGVTTADRVAKMDQRHIVRHKGKSDPKASKGSASTTETVHMEPFQDNSRPESTNDPADMSHLETHMPTPRSRGGSVISNLADSDFQSALVESQTGITELKDIVVKKLTDDKPDNPRLGFCDFLKVEVVQLTSDFYDEFQQGTFNVE